MDLRPSTLIQRLNNAVKADDDEPEAQPAPVQPAQAAPVAPAQPVRGGAGMVDWWAARNAGVNENDEPEASTAAVTSTAGEFDFPEEFDELDEDGGEEESGGGDKAPSTIRSRWGLYGSGKKTYNRPVYATTPSPKTSLIEAWGGMTPKTRHLLYNGAALGAGFYIGVPQFFTAQVAYLVATYDSWTDFYVAIWYGAIAGIWVFDHRTRNWFPPFALAARIPLVSMIVGALLYGTPVA